jgi:transposase
MYDKAGLQLVYLPPYFPELDSIKEFFAGLKAFINGTGKSTRLIRSKALPLFLE